MEGNLREAVENACCLEGQPLSKRSLRAIVHSYTDDSGLMKRTRQPEADQDFTTAFIKDHEGYVLLKGEKEYNLRTCHNLRNPNKGGDLFLLIHGLGGTLEQFEPLLRLLDQKGKKFLAFDLPGFGKSDEWDQYPMIEIVKAINQLIYHLSGVQTFDRLCVVGHSMGCYLSLHFYSMFRDAWEISTLILLAPPKPNVDQLAKDNYWVQFGLRAGYRFPWLFDFYRETFDQSKGLSSSGIKQFFYRNGDVTNQYRKLWQFHNNVQIKSRSIFGYFIGWEEINWDNATTKLCSSQPPTSVLIMCGDEDIITPTQYSLDIYNILKDVKEKQMIVLPGCGHNLLFDYPEEVLDKLCEVLT